MQDDDVFGCVGCGLRRREWGKKTGEKQSRERGNGEGTDFCFHGDGDDTTAMQRNGVTTKEVEEGLTTDGISANMEI